MELHLLDNGKFKKRLYQYCSITYKAYIFVSFVCLCFKSLQQRGHLETAPPFTVPCEGCAAR